jgi:hypothetical protein
LTIKIREKTRVENRTPNPEIRFPNPEHRTPNPEARMNGLPPHVMKKLASHFEGFDLDRIRILAGIPRYVRMFAAIEPSAYASGHVLYFSEGAYDPRSEEGIALIGHEVTHSRQYAEFGTWRFRLKYLGDYLKNRMKGMTAAEAYRSVSFEKEARRMQSLILGDLRAQSGGTVPRPDFPS